MATEFVSTTAVTTSIRDGDDSNLIQGGGGIERLIGQKGDGAPLAGLVPTF
ncbi:MAG: hypothetical protein AAF415_19185 [Pseudomonadota bacterium]